MQNTSCKHRYDTNSGSAYKTKGMNKSILETASTTYTCSLRKINICVHFNKL